MLTALRFLLIRVRDATRLPRSPAFLAHAVRTGASPDRR